MDSLPTAPLAPATDASETDVSPIRPDDRADMCDPADPFARLTDADRAARAAPTDDGDDPDDMLALLPFAGPVPPATVFRLPDMPVPSRLWAYRDTAGAVLAVVARYDTATSDGLPVKDIRPWSHGRRVWTDRAGKPRDRTGWHCKAPPSPRPLFGLDCLAARPDAPVLLVEGEKAAEAAATIFPECVCIASLGGAKASRKSDWTPLAGRRLTIWPDHDVAGVAYAAKVATLASKAGAACVRFVEVPAHWPMGWDLADALPQDEPPERLRELLNEAPEDEAAELPPGFRMTAGGLLFIPEPTKTSPDPPAIFVTALFRVLGQTRSEAGEAWGLLLSWRDREGRRHQWAIPRRLIHRPGNEIAEELENAGLSCGPDARAHELLKRFVGGVKVARLLRCVTRTGWHPAEGGPVFVLPGGEAFGRDAADVILQADHASADATFRAAGTLGGWQSGVAALAVGNDRLALLISAGFAGPLLDVVGEPSGGLHLVGDSRTGKSTLLVAAASVWGKPTADGQLRTWRGTANGLEGVAAETADATLILDEMGQADPREVGDVVYMLANETGKQRASRTGQARARQTWRTLFLSSGEVTLAQKMGEAGKHTMSGLDVRLPTLPADAGAGLGVFQDLHGRPNAAALAEELRDAARTHHGTAARAFLARLARDRATDAAGLRAKLDSMRAAFVGKHVPEGSSAQVRALAVRFALIGIAGEMARGYGILPWPKGEALRAAGACFAALIAERGGTSSGEDAAGLAKVRAFLEAHGESRFTSLLAPAPGAEQVAPEAARTINRVGWRRRVPDGGGERWEYLIFPEAWKGEVCKGLNARNVANLLHARGLLLGGDERHRAALVTIPGEGKRRLYIVSGAILGGNDAE